MSKESEKKITKEHALKFFRRYVKPGKTIYVITTSRTRTAEYLRFFIVSVPYSMGSHKPGIQDITYSVAKLTGCSLKGKFGGIVLRHVITGDKPSQSMVNWINRIVFGDDTSKYYDWMDL